MQMQTTYGIFDDEADHLIAMVRDHAPLDAITATPCPACGASMVVAFNDDGTGFSLNCKGDPLHITVQLEISLPPPWWQQCYQKPRDTTWYWLEWHSYAEDGSLQMKISGWRADGSRWSGTLECPRDHRESQLWQWIISESGYTKELISDHELDELRAQYLREQYNPS